jgi:hypothetical protein
LRLFSARGPNDRFWRSQSVMERGVAAILAASMAVGAMTDVLSHYETASAHHYSASQASAGDSMFKVEPSTRPIKRSAHWRLLNGRARFFVMQF